MEAKRELRPTTPAISTDPPSEFDVVCTSRLAAYMDFASPQETPAEQQKRVHVLSSLAAIFREWVHSVCIVKGFSEEVADKAGGQVFTSGSYRLGVNERGMDIDTICVAPRMVTREDFFDSLKVILEDHDSVTNLTSIESATVPIITFDFDDVNVDLLFASLPRDSVPEDIDLNNDNVLRGLDLGSERTLNGPRVTNLIQQLVPKYDAFLLMLRCVRLWAKRRGIYSNKFGFLGGVNCNILVAFVCQRYPNAASSLLLERFFYILKDWEWPTPIMLTPPYDAGLGLECWDPQISRNRFHVMPILTPAYPSMNSSMSVSDHTLEVMRYELQVAHEKVRAILSTGAVNWDPLFEPSEFWVAHSKYLAVEIFVANALAHEHAELLRSWTGFVESRLRGLVDQLAPLPLCNLRLMPKKLPLLTTGAEAQNGEGSSYVIGFDIDKDRMQGEELHMTAKVEQFRSTVLFAAEKSGIMTERTHQLQKLKFVSFDSWKELPDVVFEKCMGGRDAAKAVRKRIVKARKAMQHEGGGDGQAPSGGGPKRAADGEQLAAPVSKASKTAGGADEPRLATASESRPPVASDDPRLALMAASADPRRSVVPSQTPADPRLAMAAQHPAAVSASKVNGAPAGLGDGVMGRSALKRAESDDVPSLG